MPEYQVTIAVPPGRSGFGKKISGVFSPCAHEAELTVLEQDPTLVVADVCRIPGKIEATRKNYDEEPLCPFQLHLTREP